MLPRLEHARHREPRCCDSGERRRVRVFLGASGGRCGARRCQKVDKEAAGGQFFTGHLGKENYVLVGIDVAF